MYYMCVRQLGLLIIATLWLVGASSASGNFGTVEEASVQLSKVKQGLKDAAGDLDAAEKRMQAAGDAVDSLREAFKIGKKSGKEVLTDLGVISARVDQMKADVASVSSDLSDLRDALERIERVARTFKTSTLINEVKNAFVELEDLEDRVVSDTKRLTTIRSDIKKLAQDASGLKTGP